MNDDRKDIYGARTVGQALRYRTCTTILWANIILPILQMQKLSFW